MLVSEIAGCALSCSLMNCLLCGIRKLSPQQLLLVLFWSVRIYAQTGAATNHALELDGTGGYVELPPNIFNQFTQATIEIHEDDCFDFARPAPDTPARARRAPRG